ncbi:hypothetical protein VPHD506_0093 [Vibrio phage D506]
MVRSSMVRRTSKRWMRLLSRVSCWLSAGGELVGKVVGYERCGDTMSILLEPEKKLLKHIKQGWVGIWGSFQVKMYEDQTVDVDSFTQYTVTFTPPSKF